MNLLTGGAMPRRIAIGSALIVALIGCGVFETTGSGPTKSETRTVGSFARVEAGNGIGVTVHIGPTQAVEVAAQESILPVIATSVEGGVLKIRSIKSYSTSEGVKATITVPALDGIALSGGSQGQIDGLAADHLEIALSGGAGVSAQGTANDVTLGAVGGARADLVNLLTNTIGLDLSGGATAALRASGQVTGSASGGATATVTGGATVSVQTSGGASVTST
jgi:hypothetical protein